MVATIVDHEHTWLKHQYANLMPCLRGLPFMSGPAPLATVVLVYLLTIYSVGPRLMARRQPFQLRLAILTYDAMQIALNVGLLLYGYFGMVAVDGRWTYTCMPSSAFTARATYAYFLLKLFDLLETVIFVLRKKYGQVSVLHVYHHVAVLVGVHASLLVAPGGHSTFIGFGNLIVHAAMYGYYFAVAYDRERAEAYARWKIRLTQMQIVQFLCYLGHFAVPLLVADCDYSPFVCWLVIVSVGIVLVLFGQFYARAYGWRLR